jgi:hypothetical protein
MLDIYTPERLADLLGISTKTLANWRASNRGPRYCRLGGRGSGVVYRAREVDEWLDAQLVDTTYWR